MAIYLIKVNLAIIVLYGFYKLMCSGDTFFRWRRIALQVIYFIALTIPITNMSLWANNSDKMKEVATTYASFVLPNITVTPDTTASFNWVLFFLCIYIIIVACLFIRLLWQLISIYHLKQACNELVIEHTTVYEMTTDSGPFSFFNWIFINPQLHAASEIHEILVHEKAHAHQVHSFDILLSEIFNIVFWVNPFTWLLKHEVRINLEYLADHTVLASDADKKTYQYHLLGLTYKKNVATLSNNFNVLPLKKRIKMMNKKRSNAMSKAKYLLFAPLIAVMLLISNVETVARTFKVFSPTIKATPALNMPRDKKVYKVAAVMPRFKGDVNTWLCQQVKYPEAAAKAKQQGRVIVQFVVSADGTVYGAKVLRGVSPALDKEALRVVSIMPKWIPGKEKGKNVAVSYCLPITFKLQ